MKLKDKILIISDQEYRDIPAFSYSLLKAIDEEGPQIITEPRTVTGKALEFGQLVDILLTAPENRYSIFHTKTVEKPTASLLQLADALLLDMLAGDLSISVVDDNFITNKIKELGLWNTIVDPKKLKGRYDVDVFWNYIIESINAKGKIIISQDTLDAAEHCANVLKTHPYTADLFVETDDIEILYQASLLYPFKKTKGKARLDLIRVDHKNKIIYPYDIKTGSKLPSKFEESFYEFKYYLQVISYLLALQYMVEHDKDLKGYKIDNFRFIYISKKLPDVPAIYEVPEGLLMSFFNGWNGNTGFNELVDNYKYATENEIYNSERKIVEHNGCLKITLR